MKKRMRKAVAIAATAAMVGSLPAGAVTAQAADDDITIGVSIWSSTDVLGSQSKKIIDKAADALGVNVMYVDQGHVSEQVTASVEQLCAAGCNGIVICNSADSEMTSAIQTCDANQVYLTQFYRIISEENSPEVYQTACNSQYYLGAVHEDEVTNGYTLVNLLLENGDRNIGLEAWTVGDATFQQRWKGYKQAVDEWNEANPDDQATITEPVYANTSSEEGAAAALSLYNSNPDMDALIVAGVGGDPLEGVEDDRVMGNNQLGAELSGLFDNGGGAVQREQSASDFPVPVADQDAGVVKIHGEPEWREPVDGVINVGDGGHKDSS